MRRLAPDLFDRRFDALVEGGRSRLPSLAPRWTDYNAHDPGITLLELLAWTTEAQLYSLGRMRRDERTAYAALLGLRPRGPTPASGTLWADRSDRDAPILAYRQAIVLERDARVRTAPSETPEFHPTHRILWSPGRIVALRSHLANRDIVDLTQSNEHGDRAFEPFGSSAGPSDVLRLEFQSNGSRGLFPERRELAAGALWTIGVRVDGRRVEAPQGAALNVIMRIGTERVPLRVVADGTRGFMQSGVLLLDVSDVPGTPSKFTLEFSAVRGFARPPRILRIEPGVLPIVQGGSVVREAHAAGGAPMQEIRFEQPGLRFGGDAAPVCVEVIEDGERQVWKLVDDLAKSGPHDRVYELDTQAESIVLGNGINGHQPAFQSSILIDYPYCSGASANTPRNQRWIVRGVSGVFGINPDAIDGGSDALRDADLRREARRRLRAAHALVTTADIEAAAREVPDLQVARAHVSLLRKPSDMPREVALIALRARSSNDEPAEPPETSRWLAAVRRALLPNLVLGTRLQVRAPHYRTFSVRAQIELQPRHDPEVVYAAVKQALRDAFTLVPRQGLEPRKFGAPVSQRDLAALIRRVTGVRRIIELSLQVERAAAMELQLKPTELPRLDLDASDIKVVRATGGVA
jgi:hypothetical protein